MSQPLSIPDDWCWYDQKHTILQVVFPAELTSEWFAPMIGEVSDALKDVPYGVAAVVDLTAVDPPVNAVGHFREMFNHPLLQQDHLEMIAVIVDNNRPMRVLSTLFRRLYAMFGKIPIHIVSSLDEALMEIRDERPPGQT